MRTCVDYTKSRLRLLGVDPNVLDLYNEKHRHYHNFKHIEYMFKKAYDLNIEITDDLFLAIVFHDIVYDPTRPDNEEQSILLLNKWITNSTIDDAIFATKNHTKISTLSGILNMLDLCVLYDNFADFVIYDSNIYKEYSFVDFDTYIEKRIEILTKYKVNKDWLDYVKNRKYERIL